MELVVSEIRNLEIGFGGALGVVIVLHNKNTILCALDVEIKNIDTGLHGLGKAVHR